MARCSKRACAARALTSSTGAVSVTWNATTPNAWNAPRATAVGAPVGDAVATWAKQARHETPPGGQIAQAEADANQFLERKGGENPWVVRDELGKLMWERVGIVRDGGKLKRALDEIDQLASQTGQLGVGAGRA